MHKIIRARSAHASKIAENQHQYPLIELSHETQRSLTIIEAAEITESINPDTDSIYYLLAGTMTVDNQILKKGDCCFIPHGDTVIIAGTFKALLIT